MKIWVHINGVQEGPFEPNELPLDRMNAETPVWYEGLEYWMPAGNTELTARYFNTSAEPKTEHANAYQSSPRAAYSQTSGQPQQTHEDSPSTYIVWSVLLTLLCCNPIGIVPLVLGCTVSSKLRNYDYNGARRASETTAWWLMVTIVTSLINLFFTPLMML